MLLAANAAIEFLDTRPHTLDELSAAADASSQPGYHDHHIVTQGGKNATNIPQALLQSRDNIVSLLQWGDRKFRPNRTLQRMDREKQDGSP